MNPPKVALVTGAARRVGRAMAIRLGALGYAVGVPFRTSEAEAAEVVATITADGWSRLGDDELSGVFESIVEEVRAR